MLRLGTDMTNNTFDIALQKTLAYEGGYANVVGDAGGETYKGISRVFHPSWDGWFLVDDWKAGVIGSNALEAALRPALRSFYKAQFWDRFQGDKVAAVSPIIAIEMFDTAVNMGVHRAVKFLQTALNMQNRFGQVYADIAVDGVLGQHTLLTLKRYLSYEPGTAKDNEQILLNCMNGEQYIVYKNNAQHERFRGWFRRV